LVDSEVVCAAGCGECCMGGNWRFVFTDAFLAKGENLFRERGGKSDPWEHKRCFFHDEKQGCTLSRHERPNVCRTYICQRARCAA